MPNTRFPEAAPRDAAGNLLAINIIPVNLYSSDYMNGTQRVSSYATLDVAGYVELPGRWVVNVGARNFLNADFPFLNNRNASYDPSRVDPRGRVLYMQVRKSFAF